MEFTFPVVIGLIGGHGDCGDAEITIDITEEEYELIQASEEEYLADDEALADVYHRADEAFREQQEEFGYDLDEYTYQILIPDEE